MNCQDFEASINDLARDQIMDSARRAGALAHSEGCRECAARLADERMLSAGLSRLAASASNEQAPVKVEAALLAHFRERKQIPVAPIKPRGWQRWAIAAAAAVLILIALVALRANQSAPEPEQKATNETQPALPAVQPQPEQKKPEQKNSEPKKSVMPRDRKRELQNHYADGRSRRAAPNAEENKGKDGAASDYEIATDFISLTPHGSFAQWEGGQVVRVELPRSAMASFGLPVNLERAGERIKADVVVGNDGMARAIRFVR